MDRGGNIMEMYLKKDDKDIFRFPVLPSAINV